jgi:hypothetical protein
VLQQPLVMKLGSAGEVANLVAIATKCCKPRLRIVLISRRRSVRETTAESRFIREGLL